MINYNWTVVQMERKAADGFVTTVHYNVSAVDGDYSASTYGTVGFTQEEMDYIPFEQLTPEQVIGWVKDSLGQETVEEALAAQIEAQKNPVQQSGLPWAE
jgi:propanediol dehydratase small subunit